MEIRYLENHQIDKAKWDDCVSKSVNGIVYAYSWYLDVVSEDWDALIDGDYQRVFPLPFKQKHGVRLIYQPFFTQQLGVISQSILTQDIVTQFLNSIPKKFNYIEINLNNFNKIDSSKFEIKPLLNHELDLINSYKNISKKYSGNLKRKLKKISASKLFISPNTKPDEIINLFSHFKAREFPHLRENDYIVLRRLIYTAIHRGVAQIYGVYNSCNILCAGGFFLYANQKITFIFSGSTPEGRDLSAIAFLIDYVIHRNSGKHLTLDFEGSNNPGLAQFYKSFGSKEIIYFKTTINRLNLFCRIGMKLSRKYRFILSRQINL